MRPLLVSLVFVALPPALHAADGKPLEFRLTFTPQVSEKPFTGRVFVLLTKGNSGNLPGGLNWFRPEPTFALDVKDWNPGEPLKIDGSARAYPTPLAKLAPGTYTAFAVMDFDRGASVSFTTAEGNGY